MTKQSPCKFDTQKENNSGKDQYVTMMKCSNSKQERNYSDKNNPSNSDSNVFLKQFSETNHLEYLVSDYSASCSNKINTNLKNIDSRSAKKASSLNDICDTISSESDCDPLKKTLISSDTKSPPLSIRPHENSNSSFNYSEHVLPKFQRKTSVTTVHMHDFVDKIHYEQSRLYGVQVFITANDIHGFNVHTVDEKLWISDIRDWKNLSSKLHVGDRILKINDKFVNDTFKYQQLIKNYTEFSLTIERLPRAKVLLYDKNSSNQIKLKGKKFFFIDANKSTQWEITEINRDNTFNLIDDNQVFNIQSRINSNVQHLSIIMHPKDFLKSIRSGRQRKFSFSHILR